MAAAAPARRSAPVKAPRKPAQRKAAPRLLATSAASARPRAAPPGAARRARSTTRRSSAGQRIPLAVGRTATAVGHLPDSGLVVRLTRGRAWIAVLGVLLAGIVALNVITLSLAASTGKIYQSIEALERDNSIVLSREAHRYATARIRGEAQAQGLSMPAANQVHYLTAAPGDVGSAAARLAAAAGG